MRTADLANLLGISSDALLRAKDRGELRPSRIGRNLLWPVPEVEAWLEQRRVGVHHSTVVEFKRRSA